MAKKSLAIPEVFPETIIQMHLDGTRRKYIPVDGVELRAMLMAIRIEALDGMIDQYDQYSERIRSAFPTNSGSHSQYETAIKMINNRHTKGSLVALVNWLLLELRNKGVDL